MVNSEQYNIIIIDPSPIILEGLKHLLQSYPGFQVTHTFSDYKVFESANLKADFHIILFNPAIISYHKQFSVKNLFNKYPEAIILAIQYSYIDTETLANFDGVINIYNTPASLIKKILKSIETVDQNKHKTHTDSNIDLSDREKEILVSVAIGLTNKEIAEKLNISAHTVMSHRKNISRKIGIKTVSGLTIYAIFNNLISEDDL